MQVRKGGLPPLKLHRHSSLNRLGELNNSSELNGQSVEAGGVNRPSVPAIIRLELFH